VRLLNTLKGRTPYELLTGNTSDISELLEFSCFQPVWYYEPNTFPHQNKHIVRWLGITHQIGQSMCYWLLPESGSPIARTTIQSITDEELNEHVVKQRLDQLDEKLNQKFYGPEQEIFPFTLYREDKEEDDMEIELMEPEAQVPEIDDIEADSYDQILLTEPLLIKEGELVRAKIIGRKRDMDGNLISTYDHNPSLNT
jgi:hypothetical protein